MERVTQSLPIDSPPGDPSARIVGSGEMAELTRSFDWGKTPLGPIENWPDTLLTTVNLLLATLHPMFFWWGQELIQFYNDGYRPSIGMDKHPSALGQRGPECWPEIWPIIGPQIEASMTRGESSWHSNQLVPIFRDGMLEEVFWTYSYSPVRDKDGIVCGTLVVCSETTEQVLGTRRQRTLMTIMSLSGRRSLPGSLAAHLIDTLAGNKDDIPFAAIFEIGAKGTAGLIAHTGAESHCFSPASWPVSEVAKSKAPQLLNNVRQRIGLECSPGPSAYILPVGSAELGTARVLLLGISSRLRFDVQYETFFQQVGNRLGTLFDLSDLEDRRKQDAVIERVLIQNEKLVAVGRLASSIAHEINNPLEAVTNLLFLIGSTALPPDAKAYVEVAQSELARVSQITLQTLRFHRQSISAREVRLSAILDDLLALFHGRLSNAALTVEKRYTQTRTILAYENDLRQVFTNIVENAIDASSLGGRIILREHEATNGRTGKKGVRIVIADTGHGMTASTREHIFKPFFTTKEATGTGLGLWVSADILSRHEATVQVRSRIDGAKHGTVFSIFFPYDAFPLQASS
jgi:signal transduction histidine kinase